MATPKTLNVYDISPRTLKETKIATFRLEGGKVQATYFGDAEDKDRHEAMLGEIIDVHGDRLITPKDGARFMELLALTWQHTSYMSVRED
jgi:hypothetical protein